MQTSFSLAQLADPDTAQAERILRSCVHCGFCTATCPTYLLLGDELDSPRGRIYLIKDMLEKGRPADVKTVKHIDRCLSCLSCMTTCPSGVHYMHLVDHARVHIEKTYRRPGQHLAAMIELASFPPVRRRKVISAAISGARKGGVTLLSGCAQQVLQPSINEAAVRLLGRHGVEAVTAKGEGCCGGLVHHMAWADRLMRALLAMVLPSPALTRMALRGAFLAKPFKGAFKLLPAQHAARDYARKNIDAWISLMDSDLDAILVTASGCGTTVKNYGYMFREDKVYAEKAKRVSAITKDISEYVAELHLRKPVRETGHVVAYHSACSMQHGQKIKQQPKQLLARMGFTVRDVPEGHICCGSAGVYNILQPDIANRLRARKVGNIEKIMPQIIATGNIGCMTQIGKGTSIPIVHTVELLDWAQGGPLPEALAVAGVATREGSTFSVPTSAGDLLIGAAAQYRSA